MRTGRAGLVLLGLVLASCVTEAENTTSAADSGTGTIVQTTRTTPQAETTTTTAVTPTTEAEQAPAPDPEPILYGVVAEERARRLAVIDPRIDCLRDMRCEVPVVDRIELPHRPHNLAALGSVVYATHPSAGAVSRVDLSAGTVDTVEVGVEPHDIKYSDSAGVLYVADEAGHRLLALDPDDLSIVDGVDLPAEPHDLAVDGETVWITLIGRGQLARLSGGSVELVAAGGSPHDLIVDRAGRVWFSNRDTADLNILDPATGETTTAPAGVVEPHHFTLGPDGAVWVSDNGGATVVRFGDETVGIEVGPVPHHLAFADDTLVVAVSGSGEAVLVREGEVLGAAPLDTGLHGVAVVELSTPIGDR